MEFVAENGEVLDDRAIERLAEPWDRGELPEGAWIGVPKLGRPRLSAEPLEVVSFKVPVSMAATIRQAAEASGETRSAFLREAAMEKAQRVLAEA